MAVKKQSNISTENSAKIKKSDAKIVKNESSTKSALKGGGTNPSHSDCNGGISTTKQELTANGEVLLTRREDKNTAGYDLHSKC